MKCAIEGFNQEYVLSLKKEVDCGGGKTKSIQIDCTDLVILRWFVDFYPNMKKYTVGGREYAWLDHGKLERDLPILGITRRYCIERMKKLVEFGILDYQLSQNGGTFSLYTFGENYKYLVLSTAGGSCCQQQEGMSVDSMRVTPSTAGGSCCQQQDKDNTIIDNTIIDKSIIDKSTETEACFNRFWDSYPRKVSKGRALRAWMKLNPDEALTEKIIAAVETAKKRDDRFRVDKYTPHPATWLNGMEWDNQYNANESGGYDYNTLKGDELPF